MTSTIKTLETSEIKVNPFEVRENIDLTSESFLKLVKSIKIHGLLQPILVRKDNGKYQIIAGTRRLTACKKSHVKQISAVVRSMTDTEARILSLTENSHRENLTDQETSLALMAIYDSAGFTLESAIKNIKQYENYLQRGGDIDDLPKDFLQICEDITDGIPSQYTFLRMAKDLSPSVFNYVEKIGLNRAKKMMLTRPTIKTNPKLQKTVAKLIRSMDDKSSRDVVHNIETGKYKFKGDYFDISDKEGDQIRMKPQEFTNDARMYFVVNSGMINDLVGHFTNSNKKTYSDDLIDNTVNFRLEKIKQLKEVDLNVWYNTMVPLINILDEMKKELDREFRTREKQKEMIGR